VTRELGQQGFRKLGDYDAVHLADAMEHRPMITLYVRDDGWATATAFCLKPDWPGLVGGLAMMAKGEYRAIEVVEFGTTFSDGATLSTSGTYDAHVAKVRAHLAAHRGLGHPQAADPRGGEPAAHRAHARRHRGVGARRLSAAAKSGMIYGCAAHSPCLSRPFCRWWLTPPRASSS
jgi:hypothetical protein